MQTIPVLNFFLIPHSQSRTRRPPPESRPLCNRIPLDVREFSDWIPYYYGLQKQLRKTDNSSLNMSHSTRNLGFIFD